MYDKELYQKILGIEAPWRVEDVELRLEKGLVNIEVGYDPGQEVRCSKCGEMCARYDVVKRKWRHLDTCQYQTIISADVPRIECKTHGIEQISVPWAGKNSRLTHLFERLVIDWLKESSTLAVAEHLNLSWKQVDGVMQRAVRHGLKVREAQMPTRIGVDETSFQKRHEYVTIITDMDTGTVIDVADDRKQVPLENMLKKLGKDTLSKIECVAMDMHQPFIQAVKNTIPDAGAKIAFDKFHVIANVTKAVNQVRRQEHLALMEQGKEDLKRTRFLWITGEENLSESQLDNIQALKEIAIKTSKAWRFKEQARNLWGFKSKAVALRAWKNWCIDAAQSELAPIQKVASMVLNHLQGILIAILKNATNAVSESKNNKIQHIKRNAYGFRNRERFKTAILFHCGGLQLYSNTI